MRCATHGEWNKGLRLNIIKAMKRISLALMLLSASLLFGAETASWYIATEPGYRTGSDTLFSSSSSEAASSEYPIGSVLELTSEKTGRSTVVTITDPLPELPEGRTLAVTEKAMTELGLMESGVGKVEERVLRLGRDDAGQGDMPTGWYMYDLGIYYDSAECFEAYRLLQDNGLKPAAVIEDGALHLYVGYVMAFNRESTEETIRGLGLDPGEAIISPNPYS